MTDVQNPTAAPTEEVAITALKKQADRMGIAYKSNTSVATLQKAIKDKMEGTVEPSETASEDASPSTESEATLTKEQIAEQAYKDAMKLVRVIITPMEATKAANLESEPFCAGNSVVPTVKRVIPFGVEWHVEEILLNSIREKKYQAFTTKKNAAGVDVTTARLVPAYNVAVLPPLTQEELTELADLQIRTRSLADE